MIKDAIEDAASLERTESSIDLYLDGWRCLEERKGGVMDRCKCGSYAINPRLHGRNPNTDLDLCDVCYFKKRLEEAEQRIADVEEELEVLDREIFVFASDVLYSKNAKNTDWLFDNAKAIYCRPRLGKGE